MALSNVSLADFHTRCVYAAFGVRASVIQHSRESLWKEEFVEKKERRVRLFPRLSLV